MKLDPHHIPRSAEERAASQLGDLERQLRGRSSAPAPEAHNLSSSSALSFDVIHTLNTRNVRVTVFANDGDYQDLEFVAKRLQINLVRITLTVAPGVYNEANDTGGAIALIS